MISVIVPVYNMEKYLTRCVESLLVQTYNDYEILLVDDGSTDSSGKMCDGYAERDSRVKVLHKPNGGESDARNHGIENAVGEYICFVDADDYVGSDYLRIMMEMMVEYNADVTILLAKETCSQDTGYVSGEDRRKELAPEEVYKKIMLVDEFGMTSWGKLYRKELFDNIRFPVGRIHDDMFTIPYILEVCDRCAYSTSVQYYYYQREGSISHTLDDENILTWLEAAEKIIEHTRGYNEELIPYAYTYFVKFVLWGIVDRLLDSGEYMIWSSRLKREYGRVLRKACYLPGLKLRQRIKPYIFLISIRLYRRLRRMWL